MPSSSDKRVGSIKDNPAGKARGRPAVEQAEQKAGTKPAHHPLKPGARDAGGSFDRYDHSGKPKRR